MLTCTIHLRNLFECQHRVNSSEHAYIFHSSTCERKHTAILLTGASSQTQHWFPSNCCVKSHCNNVLAHSISGWLSCRLCVKSWVSFSMDRCDILFFPKQNPPSVTIPPGLVHQVLSGAAVKWSFDFLIIKYSSFTLVNHKDMKGLFYHAVLICEAWVCRAKPAGKSKTVYLCKILVLFTKPHNCWHSHD